MSHAHTVTLSMVYEKLENLQKKVDQLETILLLPEEKLSDKELNEFKAIRSEMLKIGGASLADLEKKRKAH